MTILEKTQRITSSERPEFVAMYGRRRVGKTFLVNQLFGQGTGVFLEQLGLAAGQLDVDCMRFGHLLDDTPYRG